VRILAPTCNFDNDRVHDFPTWRIFTIIQGIYNGDVTRRTICFSCTIRKGRM